MNGVPAHVLIVHAVVVLIPLSAFLVLLTVLWPAARAKLGFITPLTVLLALGCIPLATSAGEWLQERLPSTPQIQRHVQMGDALSVWAFLLFVIAALYWLIPFAAERGWKVPTFALAKWVQPALGAVAVVLAVVSVVQVYRIGDSGAKAAWHGKVSSTAINGGDNG